TTPIDRRARSEGLVRKRLVSGCAWSPTTTINGEEPSMSRYWDLFPANSLPVQPFTWPASRLQLLGGQQDTTARQDASMPISPAFGWAPESTGPAGSPARTARLAGEAQPASQFALWAFGPPRRRSRPQERRPRPIDTRPRSQTGPVETPTTNSARRDRGCTAATAGRYPGVVGRTGAVELLATLLRLPPTAGAEGAGHPRVEGGPR